MTNPIPDNRPRVSTYLCVDDGGAAIDFYTEVLGFAEIRRMEFGGRIAHCELALGDSLVMLSDEWPEMGVVSPKKLGGTQVTMNVYVEDADATFAAAIAGGATELRPVEQQFYGDRSGQFEDPWGHRWGVATHVEDVDEDELARRAAAVMSGDVY